MQGRMLNRFLYSQRTSLKCVCKRGQGVSGHPVVRKGGGISRQGTSVSIMSSKRGWFRIVTGIESVSKPRKEGKG